MTLKHDKGGTISQFSSICFYFPLILKYMKNTFLIISQKKLEYFQDNFSGIFRKVNALYFRCFFTSTETSRALVWSRSRPSHSTLLRNTIPTKN